MTLPKDKSMHYVEPLRLYILVPKDMSQTERDQAAERFIEKYEASRPIVWNKMQTVR